MTTDDFIEAVRAEAEEYGRENAPTLGTMALTARAHLHGAEWARDHLAAQEPTDAEAVAYLAAFVEDLQPGEGDDWTPDTIARVKRGLRAARAARRDEEKR